MRYKTLSAGLALACALVGASAQAAGEDPNATSPTAPSAAPVADETAQPAFAAGQSGPGTIILTASPIAGAKDRFATIVEKIDRGDIQKKGGATIGDALKGVPGIVGTGYASGSSRPVIRGFDASRVRLVEDGLGSFDVSEMGPDHGTPIDPLAAQSIEVVRGAATLRYGSQAIGGVVNVINNRVPTELPDRASADIGGSFDTNASVGEGSVLLDAPMGPLAFHADGFTRHASNYDTPIGEQANSFFRGDGYSAGASAFLGSGRKSRVGLAGIHYDAKYGIPSDDTFIEMHQTKMLERSSFAVGAGAWQTLAIDAGYAAYEHKEREPDLTVASTWKNKEWDARAEAVFGRIGFLSAAALGTQLSHRDFSALGTAADFLLPARTTTSAVFGFAEAPLGPAANLQAGARWESIKSHGNPFGVPTTASFHPVSGSLGVLFDVSNSVKLGLTVSSAARAPNLVELYANGPHDGPHTFETGDSGLEKERANSIEGSLRAKLGEHSLLEASLWATKFENYIYGQLTGNLCDELGVCAPPPPAGPDADLKELFYRQQNATFWGSEAKATFRLWGEGERSLDFVALADYVRAELEDGGNVPRIPPYHIGGGFDWSSEAFDAGLLWIHAGPQTHPGIFDTPTKGYNDLSAQIAFRPFAAYRGVEVAVIGHNLTDDVQRNAASLNKDVVVLPGRNVRFVLRAGL